MLRVFHLVKGLGRGGAETLLVRTAETGEADLRTGYGYFLPWKDALVTELQARGCTVKCFPAATVPAMLLQIPSLISYLKLWRPDVIHCHLPWAGIVGRIVGKALGVPVIYTEHNLQERYHRLTRLASKLTWKHQSYVIAVSDQVRDSIQRNHPHEVPVKTVLNGIDCDQFQPLASTPEFRQSLEFEAEDIIVGTIAVFRKQKRLDRWLSIAKNLAGRDPRIQFLLVGDGPLRDELEGLTHRLEISHRCRFVGLHSEIRPYLAEMDVFLMTSEFEGLPVAMLEAMACGVPVVATSVGGIPEVITGDSQGLVCRCDDLVCIEEAVLTLIENNDYRQQIGRAGRERVISSFGMQGMRDALRETYYQCSGRSKSKPAKPPVGYSQVSTQELQTEEILDLMKATLGPGTSVAPRSPEFWAWKHNDNISGPSLGIALKDQESGRLASLRVLMRFQTKNEVGARHHAVRAVDTATHPSFQGKGLFRYLTETLVADARETGISFVFNTPNSNSLPGYLRMGWELVEAWPLQIRWMRHFQSEAVTITPATSKSFQEEIGLEQLLDAVETNLKGLRVAKTVSYVAWRYGSHPGGIYRYVTLREGERLLGLAILRIRRRRQLKEVLLCELFVEDSTQAKILLAKVLGSGLGNYAVASFPGQENLNSALRSHGFFQLPLKQIPFTVLPLDEASAAFVNPRSWCLSAGDLELF